LTDAGSSDWKVGAEKANGSRGSGLVDDDRMVLGFCVLMKNRGRVRVGWEMDKDRSPWTRQRSQGSQTR
jgi:hypothetical protein